MPLYPISNYLILLFLAFILVVLALAEDTRVALFVTPAWFALVTAIYFIRKSRVEKQEDSAPNLD
ncbi:amino acid permease [Listeria riparia FSL S10-1204]|uniref:Amino acid permease n=1 Tax=Listeria riparia FSL S10-1204 TaxID=1265816 RepID=W7D0X4_9LIST|nr:amino acid permease [Listeria riparia FSL S10-1204]